MVVPPQREGRAGVRGCGQHRGLWGQLGPRLLFGSALWPCERRGRRGGQDPAGSAALRPLPAGGTFHACAKSRLLQASQAFSEILPDRKNKIL